jgi:hypothetical protein
MPSRSTKEKSQVNLFKIVSSHSKEEIIATWENLNKSVTSKYDSTKKRIIWNKAALVKKDRDGDDRNCWTVNVTRYGVGLKNGVSIIPYHLALISKMEFMSPERIRGFIQEIKSLSPGGNHITHTCGNGRSQGKADTEVCCNPRHLHIRSKQYNESQAHCHYFLNKSEESRRAFLESDLCDHEPKCF